MPDEVLIAELRDRLPDDFSHTMLDGALHVLQQVQNPMRAQQFAATLRELITHVLQTLAPDAEVMRCPWYKQDQNTDGPVRRQRALYTCRGGLTDAFLKEKLALNPKDLHSEFSAVFQQLHKRTHVRADTLLVNSERFSVGQTGLSILDFQFGAAVKSLPRSKKRFGRGFETSLQVRISTGLDRRAVIWEGHTVKPSLARPPR
jgi:Predicted pPIWI-associating nuclease